MRQALITTALVLLVALIAGYFWTLAYRLWEVDLRSGQGRSSLRVLDYLVHSEVRETDFSLLYRQLGGKSPGSRRWAYAGESGFNILGQTNFHGCPASNNAGFVYPKVAWLVGVKGPASLKLTQAGKLALMQRVMQSYVTGNRNAGGEYWRRASVFLLTHPCMDNPKAPLLGPDDFPTPEEALNDQVWYGKWVPIVDPEAAQAPQ